MAKHVTSPLWGLNSIWTMNPESPVHGLNERLHRERVDHGFQVERDQIASVLVNGMVEPVWNLAPEWGRPLVESTMRNANVLGISVTSLAQGDFLELRRDGAVTAELTPIVVSRHIVRDGSIIGEIAVAFDSVVVQEARRHQRGLALSVLSLQVALSLGLVYLVFLVSGRLERHRVLRHVNATLREGQERFHDMASNVPGIVYQFKIDGDGTPSFPYVSPTVSSVLGVSAAEIVADPDKMIDLIHAGDRPRMDQSIETSRNDLRPHSWKGRLRRATGETGYFRALSRPRALEDGSILWNGLVLDITDLELARKELRAAHDQLERKVDERTRELAAAKDAAEVANRAKSDFLSVMSHDLRTPMNAILGFAQLLESGLDNPRPDKQRQYIGQVCESGRMLLELIDQVLDLSRIESGKMSVSIEDVALGPLIAECCDMAQLKSSQRGIGLEVELGSDETPWVRADRARLKQVLLNLLSNAVKYNRDNGHVAVSVRSRGNDVRIEVSDTGPGIPAEMRDEIFEPFSRLDQERSGIEGTGIGLTITRRLVQVMGGRIGVDSEAGRGSTFWIELPAAEGQRAKASTKVRRLMAPCAPIARANGDKNRRLVLYVEDNPANLKLMEEVITNVAGLGMISARSAELGLELARRHRPDIILMDINLPGMNGIQATEVLRTDDQTQGIPVVAVSARAMTDDLKRARKAGFHSYLTKPIDVASVVNTLRSAIGA